MQIRIAPKINGITYGTLSDFQLCKVLEEALKAERIGQGAGHWFSAHAGDLVQFEFFSGQATNHFKPKIITRDESHPLLLPLISALEAWGRGTPGFTGVVLETAPIGTLALVRLLPLQSLGAPLAAVRLPTLARLLVSHLHRWVTLEHPSLGFRPYSLPILHQQTQNAARVSGKAPPSVGLLFDAATSNPAAAHTPHALEAARAPGVRKETRNPGQPARKSASLPPHANLKMPQGTLLEGVDPTKLPDEPGETQPPSKR